MQLEDEEEAEMDVVEVDDALAILTCKRYNYKYAVVTPNDIVIPPKDILKNDFIFHGHTHRYRLEKISKCTIFNPGECAGIMEGKNKVGVVNLNNKNIDPKVINF